MIVDQVYSITQTQCSPIKLIVEILHDNFWIKLNGP